jgi:hypothetical protein
LLPRGGEGKKGKKEKENEKEKNEREFTLGGDWRLAWLSGNLQVFFAFP